MYLLSSCFSIACSRSMVQYVVRDPFILKELQRAKAKAEKERAEAAEEKKRVMEAVMKSGKSVDEILSFLNS